MTKRRARPKQRKRQPRAKPRAETALPLNAIFVDAAEGRVLLETPAEPEPARFVADVDAPPETMDEAAERLYVGADTWMDRHPGLTVSAIAVAGLGLLALGAYGLTQAVQYMAYQVRSL